ncbi:MAG: cytochrome c oxidase subunit II [Halodesulfurarchaeum sp.]
MSITLERVVGLTGGLTPLQIRSPIEVFNDIFTIFLGLGTLVGVVVIGYMLYKAYQYRAETGKGEDADVKRPELGELPETGEGGRKLFVSFGISAVIVLGLIGWTYGSLLYVEGGPPTGERANPVEIKVTGFQFGWEFTYPNGHTTTTLRIPENRPVKLKVTSSDVFHNFGIPALGLKTDAIPGRVTSTWLVAEETGTYTARCFELCGTGHSFMTAQVIVMEQDKYQQWYSSLGNETASTANGTATNNTTEANALAPTRPGIRARGVPQALSTESLA